MKIYSWCCRTGIVFCCILYVCACSQHQEWNCQHITGTAPHFSSCRLSTVVENPLSQLQVEFLFYDRTTFAVYLHVLTQEIPAYSSDDVAIVGLRIDETFYTYTAIRLGGAQKVLLPEDASHMLYDTLTAGKSAVVILQGYSTTINAESFPSLVEAIQ